MIPNVFNSKSWLVEYKPPGQKVDQSLMLCNWGLAHCLPQEWTSRVAYFLKSGGHFVWCLDILLQNKWRAEDLYFNKQSVSLNIGLSNVPIKMFSYFKEFTYSSALCICWFMVQKKLHVLDSENALNCNALSTSKQYCTC